MAKPVDSSFIEKLKTEWMATVDAIVDPLAVIDLNYQVIKTNKAMSKVGGVDIRSTIGKKCYQIFANRESPCPGCNIESTRSTGKDGTFELESQGRYFEVTSQPLKEGKVLHIYRDRTEARLLQKQLVQNEKLASIGLLAGGIAHEINNPLGGILIFAQMLLRELDEKSPHHEDVKEIETAALRCKEIVESLLDFARAGNPPSKNREQKPFILQESIESALKFATVGDNGSKIDISTTGTDTPILVVGSANKMTQIFLNLFQNAFQAMPSGGNLTISWEHHPDQTVSIEVSDTGVGIAEQDLEKIFDPFYTSKEPGEGTGLGLSICMGIAREMGGSLSATSRQGHGTQFKLQFPTACDQPRVAG